jgi:hypothetical protein
MTFQYKKPRNKALIKPTGQKLSMVDEAGVYVGQVQGKKAAQGEENVAAVLDDRERSYYFRYIIGTPNTLGAIEIDFVDTTNVLQPIAIDDMEFIHAQFEQKQKDIENDGKINMYFAQWGGAPIVHVDALSCATKEGARYRLESLGLI